MTLTLDVRNAPARFREMSGVGDNGVRYGPGRNQPGKCTRWVWLALGGFQNTTPLPSAVAAWEHAPSARRHPLTVKPFAGAVGVFGATAGPRWAGDVNWPYGDVVMFTGEGLDSDDWRDWVVRGTDAAGLGVIADVTMGVRYVQTGRRPVLGWIDSYGGAVLINGGTPSPKPTPTPAPVPVIRPEEDEMKRWSYTNKNGKTITKVQLGAKTKVLNNVTVAGEVFEPPEQLALLERVDDSTLAHPARFNQNEATVIERILKGLR
ncbi:hypothetical protein [Curtobacterium flaccumfaciens]|uniref:hypothetical protein n=1 Tax=Curtobacterium flaccumfaciens TaxID=2035 RepID=UPI00188D9405|nr:hypothetical protein [Curtobacterium flaccumfaciens]MBF4628886.1 hypothetical protein [Curtobacterium flaccumfaciens]